MLRPHQWRKRLREAVSLKELHDELLRHRGVVVRNAHRTEHLLISAGEHEDADPLPKERERQRLPLILNAHERATEFDGIGEFRHDAR